MFFFYYFGIYLHMSETKYLFWKNPFSAVVDYTILLSFSLLQHPLPLLPSHKLGKKELE